MQKVKIRQEIKLNFHTLKKLSGGMRNALLNLHSQEKKQYHREMLTLRSSLVTNREFDGAAISEQMKSIMKNLQPILTDYN